MKRTGIPNQRISNYILRLWDVADSEVRKSYLENLNDLQLS